jgi:hypothetical protein
MSWKDKIVIDPAQKDAKLLASLALLEKVGAEIKKEQEALAAEGLFRVPVIVRKS